MLREALEEAVDTMEYTARRLEHAGFSHAALDGTVRRCKKVLRKKVLRETAEPRKRRVDTREP